MFTSDKAIKDKEGTALKALPSYITSLNIDHLKWSPDDQSILAYDKATKKQRKLTNRPPILGKKRVRAQMSASMTEDEDQDYAAKDATNENEPNTPSTCM